MRVDKLTFTSEQSGTSQNGKPPLSSWEKTAQLSPGFWGLEWGDVMTFGGPRHVCLCGTFAPQENILKSYFITVKVSVFYEDVCFDLKVYFFLLILKEMKAFPRALGTVLAGLMSRLALPGACSPEYAFICVPVSAIQCFQSLQKALLEH